MGAKRFTNVNPYLPRYACPSPDKPNVSILSSTTGPGCVYEPPASAGSCTQLTVRPNPASETLPKPTTRVAGAGFVTTIPLQKQGGTFVVPVLINNVITLNFIVDSGASDVTIPADVVTTLMRTGTLKQTDFLGDRTYVLADGSEVSSQTFRIRSMRVGNRVVENLTGSVAPVQGSLLLGQSFLSRFKSWSIDNSKQALLLE